MTKIKIKEATIKDVDGILNIQMIVWPILYANQKKGITQENIIKSMKPKSKESAELWKKVILTKKDKGGKSNTWVAKDNNHIVGFCYAVKGPDIGKIRSIYILPEYQNKGNGYKLMEYMLDWFGDKMDITLEVVIWADNAIKFYEEFGFKKTGNISTQQLIDGKEIPECEMIRKFKL